jgi:hypothetical protein
MAPPAGVAGSGVIGMVVSFRVERAVRTRS